VKCISCGGCCVDDVERGSCCCCGICNEGCLLSFDCVIVCCTAVDG